MLGLRPAAPDPGARIGAAEIGALVASSLASAPEPASEAERKNPMVRTIASLLGQHGVGTAAGASAVTAASAALAERLASARRYQEGVAWGGVCFATYNLVAFAFAFVLLGLVTRLSARTIHLVCLVLGGLGLLSVLAIGDAGTLLVAMVGVGVAWASILSMPYAMLANALPADKMGFYMGVFNFFIVLPQIAASLGLGFFMRRFLGNDATSALVLGGASMLLAAALTLRVREEEVG
jgi:hypothetical protein